MDFKNFLSEATAEKYFLCANGEVDSHAVIRFDKKSAFGLKGNFEYIDSFDVKGNHVNAYKWDPKATDPDGNAGWYTEDF